MIRRVAGVLLLLAAIAGGACASPPPPESEADAERNEGYQRARDTLPSR
jgi:hypothetical protein